MNKQIYSDYGIGEVVIKTGVTEKQIRYWCEKKYLENISKIVCGKISCRRFNEDHIKLIQSIKSYLDQGFSLKGAVRISLKNLKIGGDENGN